MNVDKHIAVALQWIQNNRERFWAITGSLALIVLLTVVVISHREGESNEAWTQLGAIQNQLAQRQYQEAKKNLEAWQPRFQSSDAATYAKFMQGDLLYRT